MNDSRLPTLVYVSILVLGLMNWARAYPQLPETMASHFNARGVANGYAPKPVFFLIMIAVVGLTAVVGFVAPRLIAAKSDERLNLPNKNYWLAPERRKVTFDFIKAQMVWFGCAVLVAMLYGTSLAIRANLPRAGSFDSQAMLYAMGGFGLFCILWLVHFLRHFYNVPSGGTGSSD